MNLLNELREIGVELLGDPDFKQGSTQLISRQIGTGGTIDEPAAVVETSYEIDGTVRGVSAKYVASGLAVGSELQITMSNKLTVAPTIGDAVVVDGTRHQVLQVITKPAAGVPVVYTLILER